MDFPLPDDYFRGNELEAARAIAAGNPAALERVLTFKFVSANAAGEGGMTLLLLALATHQHACLRLLLDWKANPNLATAVGPGEFLQPVALAAEYDDVEQLRILLEQGGDPNSQHRGEPALFGAIYAGNWPALRLLAERWGTNLNRPRPDGATPVLLLAYLNQFEQVAYLLEKGADFAPADESGGTLAFAVQAADLDPDGAAHRWQQRVQRLLEARGVTFPVPDPSVAWAKKQAAAEKQRQQWARTPDGRAWEHRVNQAACDEAPGDDGVALMELRQAAQAAHEQWEKQQPAPDAAAGVHPAGPVR